MSNEIYLPKPNDEELNMTSKHAYFARIIKLDLDKKYKITASELYDWIHHNFQGVYLLNEEISLKALRKLTK